MDSYRVIFKRVGIVLIVFGVLDIAYMVYAITHRQNYSSSFNIFAVIAGAFLLRGSLRAVRLVTWFAAFMLAGFVGVVVLFPFLQPAGLWAIEFRLDPIGVSVSLLLGAAVVLLLVWVYRQLRAAPVLSARAAAGQSVSPPKSAFVLGAILVTFLAATLHFTTKGSAGDKAVELAKAQCGTGYNYYVKAMRWSGGHVWADLSAYNEHEIKQVKVDWEQ